MAQPIVKCGNSNSAYNAAPAVKEDEAPRRVTTRMHFLDRAPVAASFRVVVRLRNRGTAFLVAADTRAEAIELARKRVADVPVDATRLMVERWEGGERFGTWVTMGTRRGELPVIALPRRPRRRAEIE